MIGSSQTFHILSTVPEPIEILLSKTWVTLSRIFRVVTVFLFLTFSNRLDRKTTFFFLENLVQGVSQAFRKTCKRIEFLNELEGNQRIQKRLSPLAYLYFVHSLFWILNTPSLKSEQTRLQLLRTKTFTNFRTERSIPEKRKNEKGKRTVPKQRYSNQLLRNLFNHHVKLQV